MGDSLQGKISVKHYLNKKLNPKIYQGKKCFPLYLRIGFQNKVTEIKSSFYDYSPPGTVDELIHELRDEEPQTYFTEEQFKLKLNGDGRLLAEQETVINIVDMFRKRGINILTLDSAGIINACSRRLDQVLASKLKIKLKDEFLKNDRYTALRQIVNWEMAYFRILSALKSISKDSLTSTNFYDKVLSKYIALPISSVDSIAFEGGGRTRLYQWSSPEFRKKVRNELLTTNPTKSVTTLCRLIDEVHSETLAKINLG